MATVDPMRAGSSLIIRLIALSAERTHEQEVALLGIDGFADIALDLFAVPFFLPKDDFEARGG
jgi:hypothetical protein